jgi:hypothetical protein
VRRVKVAAKIKPREAQLVSELLVNAKGAAWRCDSEDRCA